MHFSFIGSNVRNCLGCGHIANYIYNDAQDNDIEQASLRGRVNRSQPTRQRGCTMEMVRDSSETMIEVIEADKDSAH